MARCGNCRLLLSAEDSGFVFVICLLARWNNYQFVLCLVNWFGQPNACQAMQMVLLMTYWKKYSNVKIIFKNKILNLANWNLEMGGGVQYTKIYGV